MYRVGIPRLCILSPERVCTVSESMFSPWLYKLCISWNMRLGRDSVLMKPSQNRVPFLLDFDNVLTQYRPCTDPVITRFGFFRILLQNLYRAKKGSFSGFVQKIYRVKKVSIQSRSVCTLSLHCLERVGLTLFWPDLILFWLGFAIFWLCTEWIPLGCIVKRGTHSVTLPIFRCQERLHIDTKTTQRQVINFNLPKYELT